MKLSNQLDSLPTVITHYLYSVQAMTFKILVFDLNTMSLPQAPNIRVLQETQVW